MNDNLVSIIIPTYNRVHLIGETLDSILAQTHINWECIIVEDGSGDDTANLIAKYVERDPRFQYHQRPVDRIKGANACRNYGFEQSKGNYIKWFDSDDIMHPKFLEKQVVVLEENKDLDFCACLSFTFNENSNVKTKNLANRYPTDELILSYLVKNHFFFTGSPLWKKLFLKNKILFDENLTDSHESDFHLRMLLDNPKYIYTDDFLFSIRRGNDSITQNSLNRKSSLKSKIVFFSKAKNIISSRKDISDNTLITEYLTFRISGLIYELCLFNPRIAILQENIGTIKDLVFQKESTIKTKVNLVVGFGLLLFFGRGYNFLRESLNIREEICN